MHGVEQRKRPLPGLLRLYRFDLKRQHRPAQAGLLRHGQFVLRVAGQTGVMNQLYCLLVLQPQRQGQGPLRLSAHAQIERLKALENHPGVEGRQGHAPAFEYRQKFLTDHILAGAQRARHNPPLAVEVFGARVHDDVSAQNHRALQCRRGKAVVHSQQCAGVVCQVGQRGNVADLGQGVGGGLDKQQPRVALDCRLPGAQISLGYKS